MKKKIQKRKINKKQDNNIIKRKITDTINEHKGKKGGRGFG